MTVAQAEIPTEASVQAAFGAHQKHGAVRAFRAASETIWASLESTARQVLEIAARQHLVDETAVNAHREALAARRGNYRDDAYAVEMRGSIALVYVEGTIFRYANLFTYYSGGTAVSYLAKDFNTVLDDPTVTDIVLVINSGGGQVDGINEFANMVYATRGRKRVWAYVSCYGCSAAYWIASAAERIICDDTAILGSIGVRCVHLDDKKALEMEGYKEIPFISSQSPNKCPDPATPKGASAIQLTLNQTAEVFIDAVARNRGITPEAVVEQYGAGGTMVGKYAVEAGLADALGSLESVLAELGGDAIPGSTPTYTARADRRASSTPTRGATVMAEAEKTAQGATDTTDEEDEEMKDEKKDKKEEGTSAQAPPPATPTASTTAPSSSSSEPSADVKALQAELAEERRLRAESTKRIEALEKERRTARFKETAKDFIGGPEAHLAMMEHLATSAGEDSKLFTSYVETQSAAAEQVKASALFEEKGRTGSVPANSAEAQLNAKAKELMAADTKLTFEQAFTQACEDNPALYNQSKAEQSAAV